MVGVKADLNTGRRYPGDSVRPKSARADALRYADEAVRNFCRPGKGKEEDSPVKGAHEVTLTP